MEVAVRNFIGDVSRFLDQSLGGAGGAVGASCGPGGWEASCRLQLQRLQRQLKQLLQRYPSLRPPSDQEDLYDDTGDTQQPAKEELYDDTGDPAEPVKEELYDDTGDPEDTVTEELYDDTGEPAESAQEQHYDDTVGAADVLITEDLYEDTSDWLEKGPQEEDDELGPERAGPASDAPSDVYDDTEGASAPYLPMVNRKAARTLGLREPAAEGKPTPPPPTAAPAVDPEAVSMTSQTSQESLNVEQVPAAQLCCSARRWGRVHLRQDSKLWPYRPYWAGLANGRLYLYRRETDPAQKRSVNLTGYEVRAPPPGADVSAKRRPVCFELVKPGGRTHQLLALTPKDARQWMAALETEGVLAGRAEPEQAERVAPGPDPAVTAAAAAAAAAAVAAAAATVPLQRPLPAEEEEVYAQADEEEDIYDDISWPDARPRPQSGGQSGRAVSYIEEDIYECIGSPPVGPEPSWPAPVLPRLPPGRTGSLPPVPGQSSAASLEPPPLPDRTPLAPPRPPPQRGPTQPPSRPSQPPRPPQRGPGAPAPAPAPAQPTPTVRPARVPTPTEVIEEDLYDELNDVAPPTALPPPSDPFYNVLEPEYLHPRHASPVPLKTTEEPPDEGYGNSSGGSENDCHPPGEESHYKTLPRTLRPFEPGRAASPGPREKGVDARGPAPPLAVPPAPARAVSPARPARPTDLPSATRPRAGTAGAAGSGTGTSSVADVIRRLNRQSVGDDEPTAAAARVSQQRQPALSAELARKQALIAGGVRALSPTGKPVKPTTLPPKPSLAAGKPKPKPAPPARQEAKTAPRGPAGRVGGWPVGGLAPNKSGVYKAMQHSRLSETESRSSSNSYGGRRTDAASVIPTEPEEEDLYAEIDEAPDDSWRT